MRIDKLVVSLLCLAVSICLVLLSSRIATYWTTRFGFSPEARSAQRLAVLLVAAVWLILGLRGIAEAFAG